jgi:hypothetical protein
MTDSRVTFSPVGGPAYTGTVVGLSSNRVEALLQSSSGSSLRLSLDLNIDTSRGVVTGAVRGAAA